MLNWSGRTMPVVWLTFAAMAPGSNASAQGITVDGRLSPAQTLAGPNYAIGAGLGRQMGGNLFHSFGAFGLKQGESATFSGPPNVGNVISRVTGGAASSIDGRIRSSITGANLYLINPAGVVFGPNASVDVSGSFHASSADYLRMQDGARFGATNPDASTLSAAPPEAFGFLSANPRPVTIDRSQLVLLTPRSTLGLAGGPVTISGGVLFAPAGTVHVASAAGPGEVPVDPRAGLPTVARSGRVQVANKANISVNDTFRSGSSGSVFVRAGDLSLADSTINADNRGSGPGGVVSLRGDRTVTISDGATIVAVSARAGRGPDVSIDTAAGGTVTLVAGSHVVAATLAAGDGGAVTINAGTLTLRDGALVVSLTQGRGNGGPINVSADSVLLDGLQTGFLSQTSGAGLVDAAGLPTPAGAGGRITLTGGTLSIQNNAAIQANTAGNGVGGSVSVAMAGDVSVTTSGQISALTLPGGGDAGSVAVAAQNVTLGDDALIRSDAPGTIQGNAVTVTAADRLTLESREPAPPAVIEARSPQGKSGGSELIAAQSITMLGNSVIGSSISSSGQGGALTVTAQGDLTLDGRGSVTGPSIATGTGSSTTSSGNAGPVKISGTNISLLHARVSSTNAESGSGAVGDLAVTAAGALTLSEQSSIEASTFNSSDAPAIRITAKDLSLASGSMIQGATFSSGRGAEVLVDVADSVSISNGDSPPLSFITGTSKGSGDAGNITINAGTLTLSHGGVITSNALSSGNGGEITLGVKGALTIDAGLGRYDTTVNSAAAPESSGSAGSVRVSAGSVSVLNGGSISSSAFGTGAGGPVLVRTPGLLLLDGGGGGGTEIAASARGTGAQAGSAGTVTISAGTVTVQGGAQIASATLGPGGGGNVGVTAGSAIRLSGVGPQINATSTGTGAAGSISVSAPQLSLRDRAGISTQAQAANGGNITIGPGDLLYLQSSSITTSVGGALGNGGNIAVEPRLVVLDRSVIQANAVGGNGGNVQIRADQLVQSFDSAITASSQRGVSGDIFIAAQPLNLNGSLVVLASELRAAAALLREGCAARGASPRSSLVVAGRGGQRQGLEATLPALYFAGRPVRDGADTAPRQSVAPVPEASVAPTHISLNLSGQCG